MVDNKEQMVQMIANAKILLVDDTPDGREPLAILLRMQGYRVSCVDGGADALRLLEKEGADLVILDLMMPEMSGEQTLARMQGDARLAETPVIVLSAAPLTGAERAKLRAMGAKHQLIKAVTTFDEVLKSVESALQGKGSGTA